jgi:hypothetical protein
METPSSRSRVGGRRQSKLAGSLHLLPKGAAMFEEAKPVIRAGRVEEIHPDSGEWVYVDIGFSAKSESCGFLGPGSEVARCMQFGQLKKELRDLVKQGTKHLNLVIEAPLSVAFDAGGNPSGRKPEKLDKSKDQPGGNRYWYVPLGCGVLVPALYLLREITDARRTREIRLFEAFVSFKERGVKSDHAGDVEALRELVLMRGGPVDTPKFRGSVKRPEELGGEASSLDSAFKVAGLDYGVPPILFVTYKHSQTGNPESPGSRRQ